MEWTEVALWDDVSLEDVRLDYFRGMSWGSPFCYDLECVGGIRYEGSCVVFSYVTF